MSSSKNSTWYGLIVFLGCSLLEQCGRHHSYRCDPRTASYAPSLPLTELFPH